MREDESEGNDMTGNPAAPDQIERALHLAAADATYAAAGVVYSLSLVPSESRNMRLGSSCAILETACQRIRAALGGGVLPPVQDREGVR
jgi:hypothetical protein